MSILGNKEKLEALKSITANSAVQRAFKINKENIKLLRRFSKDISKKINELDRGEISPHALIEDLLTEGIILTPGAKDINIDLSRMAIRVISLRKLPAIEPDTLIKRIREYQEYLLFAISHHVVNKDSETERLQNLTFERKGSMDWELIEKGIIGKYKKKKKQNAEKFEEEE